MRSSPFGNSDFERFSYRQPPAMTRQIHATLDLPSDASSTIESSSHAGSFLDDFRLAHASVDEIDSSFPAFYKFGMSPVGTNGFDDDNDDEGNDARRFVEFGDVAAGSRQDLLVWVVIAALYGMLYAGVFVAFVVSVVLPLTFDHVYPNPTLVPGSLVDDRSTLHAWLLTLDLTRVVVFASILWMLRRVSREFKRDLHRIATIVYLVFDVALVLLLLVGLLFCHVSFWSSNACRDRALYCEHFNVNGSLADRCPPSVGPPPPFSALTPDAAYVRWIWFAAAFLLLDVLGLLFGEQLKQSVRRMIYVSPE